MVPSKYDKPEIAPKEEVKKGPPPKKNAPARKQTTKTPVSDVEMKAAPEEEEKQPNNFRSNTENDDFMGESAGGMISSPPIKQKNVPKKAVASFSTDADGDTVMAETKEPPKKDLPPKKAAPSRPKTGAPSTKNVAPKKEDAKEEEDTGAMTKDEVEATIGQAIPSDVTAGLDQAAWKEKVESLQKLAEWINGNLADATKISEPIIRFVKIKLKDWKESNFNVFKEAFITLNVLVSQLTVLPKRCANVIIPAAAEKLADAKISEASSILLISLAELVTPGFVAKQVIKHGSNSKSPNVIKESSGFVKKIIEEFGVVGIPIKEVIDFCKEAASHTNPNVRSSATELIKMLYMHVGEPIKAFLNDIKESTLKVIESELEKVKPLAKNEKGAAKRALRGEAAEEMKGANNGGDVDILPRTDIKNQLTAKLIKTMSDGEWKNRKVAVESLEGILSGAAFRIQPVGLNELMGQLKNRLSDPNKSVLKSYLILVGKFAEAMGAGGKVYSKTILPALLENLTDKQNLVRNDAITAIKQWAEAIGGEIVINNSHALLQKDNPEARTEFLTWMIENKECIPKADLKPLVSSLICALQDKSPSIRALTEKVVGEVYPLVGHAAFIAATKDLKPAVVNSLKPVFEKFKNLVVAEAPPQQIQVTQEEQPKPQQKASSQALAPSALQKKNEQKTKVKEEVEKITLTTEEDKENQDVSMSDDVKTTPTKQKLPTSKISQKTVAPKGIKTLSTNTSVGNLAEHSQESAGSQLANKRPGSSMGRPSTGNFLFYTFRVLQGYHSPQYWEQREEIRAR